mgnify:CR=1 FL=1
MKLRHKKLIIIAVALAILGAIAALVLNALNSNIAFYISPTDIAAGKAPKNKVFRLGGMVKNESVKREANSLKVSFVVTDTETDIPVIYQGILPDLFSEGKGVVAQGRIENNVFVAQEVLAKHDENYMPPEAAQALGDAHARGLAKTLQEKPQQ